MRRISYKLVPLAAIGWVVFVLFGSSCQAQPYPNSDYLDHANFDCNGILATASGSDLWPTAWAEDGLLYTAWGDGDGFDSASDPITSKVSYGIAALSGTPPGYSGQDVDGWESGAGHGKIAGIVSVNGVLYMTFNTQDEGSVGSRVIAYSTDKGQSFTECSGTMWPKSEGLLPTAFVQAGQDNALSPGGYIYLFAHAKYGDGTDLWLLRAEEPTNPADLCDVGNFEYLSGPDTDGDGSYDGGDPTWSTAKSDRVSTFHDPDGTDMPSAVYFPVLDRFVLTVAHNQQVGGLGMFEAEKPWGPWKTISYFGDWCGLGTNVALGHHIPPKWISSDNHDFWMIFSSTGSLDGFNVVKGTFLLGEETPPTFLTAEIPIDNGDDDVEESADGSMRVTSSDLELVDNGSDNQTIGLRFEPVGVPQGSTVMSAYVQFRVDEVTTGPASLTVEGEASDDAAPFGVVSTRPRTSASISWTPAPWPVEGEQGPDQRTTDLAPIVQEILNRPGWVSGNALVLVIGGSGTRTAESFEGSSAGAPLLHIEYEAEPPPTDPPLPPMMLSLY